MGYGVTEETGKDQIRQLPAGINENLELKTIVVENAAKDGSSAFNVLRFYFQDKDGYGFIHTEFPIDEERLAKMAGQWGKNPKELIHESYEDFNSRVVHICENFVDRAILETKIGNAASFEDFGQKLIAAIGQTFVGVKLRLKIILNKSDYTTFPRKAISPFIQRQEKPNMLRINPKYERITPDQPDDASPSTGPAADPMAAMEADAAPKGAVELGDDPF